MVTMSYRDPVTKALIELPMGCAGGGSPVGFVGSYAGSVAPVGWVICDGRAHNSPALRALLGSDNTPDLRGRFILAASSTHAAKTTGGEETHTLTEAEMPAHNHSGRTGYHAEGLNAAHTHSVFSGISEDAPQDWDMSYSNAPVLSIKRSTYSTSGSTNTDHQHDITTSTKGSGSAHNNMPPFYAMVYIIKAFAESANGGITQADADARYVNVSGDTMTGTLIANNGIKSTSVVIGNTDTPQGILIVDQPGQGLAIANKDNTNLTTLGVAIPTADHHAANVAWVQSSLNAKTPDFGTPQLKPDTMGHAFTDCNELQGYGFVIVNVDSNSVANTPGGGWWFIMHMDHTNTNTYCTQVAYGMTSAMVISIRTRSGGGWSAWANVGP